MKVVYFDKAERYEPEQDWKRVNLCSEKNLSIEYFVKPPHHTSPMHHHPSEQTLVVIEGKMIVSNDKGEKAVLEKGDTTFFAANEPHVVANALSTPSIGIDIFTPGRSFDFWLKRKK